MRIGLLSDVHANHAALQAALRWLEDHGAERLLVAGDLVGYGPQPNECVERLVAVGAECVAGNHDLFVLDRLPPTRFPPLARHSADLTRSLISADVRAFLEALPVRLHVDPILMTHGSLDSPEEYVVDERRAGELLRRMPLEAPGSDTLVLGHTHRQWCVVADHGALRPQGRLPLPGTARLLNPGSVGQSRQRESRPRARFALYDSSTVSVEFIRLHYDVDSSRRALQQLGLPDRCLHAPPRVRGRIRGVARRILRPVRGTRASRI
ncbi:metallophosphoesterase family protein [Blastococcus mobilis]|uniref:Predicted phosphodiesterase n=1 Tax=Blastococcus mobilis TaxID=1938746 RepID=A0A238Z351_9ACTN|nr:metallophosphoesterase family protein [Blastococcus mobilis]SNR77371.1 Predicted phosphodiesterase [Blastococcus mobilis]